MYLAQRLNELAQANADGLLSDDEYRLLRQSAFELYSDHDEAPVRPSIFPARTSQDTPIPLSPARARPKDGQHGLRLSLSVSGLFRRATAKVSLPAPSPTTPESATKRGFIPRLFNRKPDLPPLRIVPPPPQSPPPIPLSPPRSTHFPSSDDHILVSSNEIADAIRSLDSELRGLVDAFDNLEQSAVRRIKKRSARRLPATTPESVDVLLEGREWREHRRTGPARPSTSPGFQSRSRYHLSLDPVSDGLSVHSERTSFSYAASPTRSTFRTVLSRKTSVSSISSKSASLLSASRLGVTVSSSSQALSSISHSSSNLPSRTLSSVFDDDEELLVVEEVEDEADQLSELHEIQQRRSEVISRYNQRIEYLKAKHKGAELREKLLRK